MSVMRVTFSLLVSSLMFGSLAIHCSEKFNHSHIILGNTGVQMLFSSKPKPKPNEPENPTPHRGSGRKDLIESLNNASVTG